MRHIQRLKYAVVLWHDAKLSTVTVEATSSLEAGQEAVAEWQREHDGSKPKAIIAVKLLK